MSLIYSNIPELEGTDTEITLANLAQLETDLERLFEKRMAHLCELANAIIKDGGDVDLVKSIILSIRSDGEIDEGRVSNENLDELRKLFLNISFFERMMIFREVFGKMPQRQRTVEGDEAHLLPEAHNRIAYMRNSYNDKAFGFFSGIMDDAKATYPESITDVCESVLNGRCEYCILPIETMRDGRLISFYQAIINYDLKICAEYDLVNTDGAGYTRYALLGRSERSSANFRTSKKNGRFVEITYSDSSISIIEILSVAEYCGLKIDSVDTLVINEISEEKRFCIVFSAENADVESFTAYLATDFPDVVVLGIYGRA